MKAQQLPTSTAEERIRLHYISDLELGEEDLRIKDRLETAHSMMLDEFETERHIAVTLMRRFDISKTTAYKDIMTTRYIFGDLRRAHKEHTRYMMTQWATEVFKMAHKSKDLRAMEKAIERITRANNLDKEDQDVPDASKIQPPVQLLQVNFNFINSPMFKLIDDATQKAMLEQYDLFMEQVLLSPMAEYTDMWKIDESVRPKKD
ncbi:MAG: hypothetical protein NT040_11150 [Bacteroidetes bacterium]|nr:hypothetical protein [Bacteroidota bacterium]